MSRQTLGSNARRLMKRFRVRSASRAGHSWHHASRASMAVRVAICGVGALAVFCVMLAFASPNVVWGRMSSLTATSSSSRQAQTADAQAHAGQPHTFGPHLFKSRSASKSTPQGSTPTPKPGTSKGESGEPGQGSGDLVWQGGNVQHSPVSYVIFWGPNWSDGTGGVNQDAQVVESYFNDVAGTSFENLLTQYYDVHGTINNTHTLGGIWLDTSTPPTDNVCDTAHKNTVEDAAIQQEVSSAATKNNWPLKDTNATFFVYTPAGDWVSADGTHYSCSNNEFCAYHSAYYSQNTPVAYAAMPYPNNIDLCSPNDFPNNDQAGDTLANLTSHEQFEAITDPYPCGYGCSQAGWTDSAGYEVGDECAYYFYDGDEHLNNGGVFSLQEEYSNATSSCESSASALPTLTLSQTSGPPGGAITVSGTGFQPNKSVTLKWACSGNDCGGQTLGTATADGTGQFSDAPVTIPTTVPAGAYAIGGSGPVVGTFASTAYSVVPMVSIAPITGTPGSTVKVNGAGFGAGEQVAIYWNCAKWTCPGATPLGTATAHSNGQFSGFSVTIPSKAIGGATAIGANGKTSGVFSDATYTVTPALTLSQTSGLPDSTIQISGSGYAPGESVALAWNCNGTDCSSAPSLGSATTDSNGQFAKVSVTIPADATNGQYTIGGLGGTSGTLAEQTFTVSPALKLSTTSGVPGASVTVSGAGYGANETVTLRWNCASATCTSTTILGTTTTDNSGQFSGLAITIPSSAPHGNFVIGGIGATSNAFADQTFSVKAALTLATTSGYAGTTITATGTGFTPKESVTLRWNCGSTTCTSTTVLRTMTTNASGQFSGASITIPGTAKYGSYYIGAKGGTSKAFAAAIYSVKPKLSLSASTEAPGAVVKFAGTGFGAYEVVSLQWTCGADACPTATTMHRVKTNQYGQISIYTFTVPGTATAGQYTLVATGATSHATVNRTFTVVPALTLSTSIAAPGLTMTISGVGYGPNESVPVVWNCGSSACASTDVLATATTDANGQFRGLTITIPGMAPHGTYAIGGTGGISGAFAARAITVVPRITFSQASGPGNTHLTITGTGYAPNQSISVKWNCAKTGCSSATTLATVTTDANGQFSDLPITIPSGTATGTHWVGAGGNGIVAYRSFTVTSA